MNNVVVRSISGVVFILAMLACLMFNKFLFAGLIIFIMSVMLLEFYHITMGNSYTFSKVLAIIAAIFLFGLLFATASYHIPIRTRMNTANSRTSTLGFCTSRFR